MHRDWKCRHVAPDNLYLLAGLDNEDVAQNINPDICFLTKAKWQSKDSVLV